MEEQETLLAFGSSSRIFKIHPFLFHSVRVISSTTIMVAYAAPLPPLLLQRAATLTTHHTGMGKAFCRCYSYCDTFVASSTSTSSDFPCPAHCTAADHSLSRIKKKEMWKPEKPTKNPQDRLRRTISVHLFNFISVRENSPPRSWRLLRAHYGAFVHAFYWLVKKLQSEIGDVSDSGGIGTREAGYLGINICNQVLGIKKLLGTISVTDRDSTQFRDEGTGTYWDIPFIIHRDAPSCYPFRVMNEYVEDSLHSTTTVLSDFAAPRMIVKTIARQRGEITFWHEVELVIGRNTGSVLCDFREHEDKPNDGLLQMMFHVPSRSPPVSRLSVLKTIVRITNGIGSVAAVDSNLQHGLIKKACYKLTSGKLLGYS
ncbi:hypothetical protein SESBI_29856 [Sesbania bispinosa]|nr:hypothetical protein SESBI_29856 [Sesbania bispinosa]